MINVLIVEDNKLTRKGIIAFMPWKDYDMEVIGEASNGQLALEFLKLNEIDLILTDLDMPVMDGYDFLEIVATEYPFIKCVVLTMFHDFDTVQKALRLGAVDYIAKEEFDKEKFSNILNRISRRFHNANSLKKETGSLQTIDRDSLYVLLSSDEISEDDYKLKDFFYVNNLVAGTHYIELGAGMWIFFSNHQIINSSIDLDGFMLLLLKNVTGYQVKDLNTLLYKYKKSRFFYDYTPTPSIVEITIDELKLDPIITNEDDFSKLKDRFLTFHWTHNASLFDKMKFDLKKSNLTVGKIYHLMIALENAWNHCYGTMLGKSLTIPDTFKSFLELEQWLENIYEETNLFLFSYSFSDEVISSVMRAKQIIETEYTTNLHTLDVANRINMSRSYFSQCFHSIVGDSFNNYLRNIRITNAKNYLSNSQKSIQWIALHTGYEDEKYFSRIFKKETGMIPSDYRKSTVITIDSRKKDIL